MRKNKIRLTKNNLRDIIKESVKALLNESQWMSDEDIHREYEDFKINEFSIKPIRYRYSNDFGWDIGFEIEFPNVEHDENHDFTKWENPMVYDEKGVRIAFDNWYPDDIAEKLKQFIRSQIKEHWPEMEALKSSEDLDGLNEGIRQPSMWSKEDSNLAGTYINIANVLPVIQSQMKQHVNNVKNGEGVITIGDIEEVLKLLEEEINNRLRGSVNNKVTITLS